MEEEIEYKSKTQKKKEAEALQKLGLELAGLSVPQLERMDIPEKLKAALIDGKSITAKVAARRHRQYIGVLMRNVDPGAVRKALDGIDDEVPAPPPGKPDKVQDRVDLLIGGGTGEIERLLDQCPGLDRQRLRQLVRNVQKEKKGATPSKSMKALEKILGDALG
ncbi:MAG: DUF615 domain-containing protein [Desulfobacter sp.]|nr:MAG: DUF615 domain-containing protein [Desulfobacter sp.]